MRSENNHPMVHVLSAGWRAALAVVCMFAASCLSAAPPAPSTSASAPASAPAKGGWVAVTNNLAADHMGFGGVCVVAAVPESHEVLAGISENWLWRTDDDGATWKRIGPDKLPSKGRPMQILFDPKDPRTFWVTLLYGDELFVTHDAGQTFTELKGPYGKLNGIGVDFTDPKRQTIVVCQNEAVHAVFKSSDGGQTWENIGKTLPDGINFSPNVLVLNAKTILVDAAGWQKGGSFGLYRTEDGGSTWEEVSTAGCVGPPTVAPDGSIYWTQLYSGKLYKSTDNGKTWNMLNSPTKANVVVLPGGKLAGVGGKKLWVSADAGATWKALGQPTPFDGSITYNDQSKAVYLYRSAEPGKVPIYRMDLPDE